MTPDRSNAANSSRRLLFPEADISVVVDPEIQDISGEVTVPSGSKLAVQSG